MIDNANAILLINKSLFEIQKRDEALFMEYLHFFSEMFALLEDEACTPDPILDNYYARDFTFLDVPFMLVWDVPSINENNFPDIESCRLPTHDLYCSISAGAIDTIKLKLLQDDMEAGKDIAPIILAEIPFTIPQFTIIDGNHRVFMYESLHRQETPSYPLSYKQHVSYLTKPSRALFKCVVNIHFILNRCFGRIPKDALDGLLFKI